MALPWPGSTALLLLWICCTAGEARNCDYVHISNGRAYGKEPATSFPKRLGDKHYYRCDSGFLPPNKTDWQTIICTRYGWDPEPNCFKKCEHTEPIRNGRFIYGSWRSPFIEGNTIFFSCDEGYNPLDESATATCTKDGWSPPPSCVTSAEIHPSSCENIALSNGFFVSRKDRFSLNEIVTYRCQSGFTTAEGHEEGQTECRAEGWKPEPKCIKTCLKPTEENAVFDTTKTTFSSKETLHYICKDGFQTVKETTGGHIQCTENGWDSKPVCLSIECEGLVLENGRVEERKDKFLNGDVVRFSCSKGYMRVGPDSAQCYHFGWSPLPPKCKKTVNPCVQPNSINPHSSDYGELREEYQHGEKVAYECDIGFVMTGSNTIECVDGEWTSLPSCTEESKTCGRPPRIMFGHPVSVDGHRYKHNETVDYECTGKIAIPGPVTARCLHGKWELPLCTGKCRRPKNTKFVPDVPPNKQFNYNEIANYSCHSGFYTTKCVGGKWSPEPECKELCPPPPQLPNAVNITEMRNYKNGEEVGFKCVEPFMLRPPQKIMCEGGRWQTPPRCVAVAGRCDRPPSIDNGDILEMAKSEYMSGEKVHYKCQNLYRMDGNAEVTCHNGHWTQPPTCIVPCTASEEDMKMNNIQLRWRGETKLYSESGDSAEFTCRRGYHPDPASPSFRVQCVDGRFEYPRCVRQA